MNFLFEIFINALEAFLILEFISHYFGFKNKSNIRYLGFIFMWIISIISITFFSWNKSFEIYSSFSQVLINIIFCILMLKGNIITKIFISAFTMVCIVLLSSFTAFFIGHIHKNSINEIYTQFNFVRIIAIFMSKVLFFQVTRIILCIKTNNILSKLDIIPFIIIPIISMCTISLLTNVVLLYPNSQKTIFYSICLIIVLSILTYYLFVKLNESVKIRYEYKLLKLKYEYEKQNIDDIKNMYEKSGDKVICLSAEKGIGIDELKSNLKNKISVFAGPSGVGKSSLINSISPNLQLKTGEISAKIERGKHTTRHAELMQIEENSYIVDSPGFTSLFLEHIPAEELQYYFREFEPYLSGCRYTGCSHIHEPECAVKEQIGENIQTKRYERYVNLYNELRKDRKK